jgi:hypothetical protein
MAYPLGATGMKRLDLPVERISALYAIGVPVTRIAADIGTVRHRVKRVVRREGIKRIPDRYGEGVRYLTEHGETFVETAAPGYWVSDMGRVLSMRDKPGTFLKPEIDDDGYCRVNLTTGEVVRHYMVHRLVLFAFAGSPKDDQLAAHNNGVRDDNRADNLRWATQVENVADKLLHGTEQVGSKHGSATTDEVAIARVKAAFRSGSTIRQAALAGGVTFHIAADVKRGRTWRHVA